MAGEKEKEKAKSAPPSEAEANPADKKKKLILLAGGGAALLILGIGGFLMFRPAAPVPAGSEHGSAEAPEHGTSEPAAEKSADHAEKKETKPEEKSAATAEHGGDKEKKPADKKEEKKTPINIDIGQTHNLKTFHLNLGNPLENRFLRMDISIEYKGGDDQKAELEARTAQLRDAVVNVTGKKTREFLLGPDGKDQLRLELLNRINQFMDRKIEAVYVTDFLIE